MFKKILSVLQKVLIVVFILIMVNVLIMRVKGQTPNIFGYSLYIIVTPSMEPELKVGDIILSKKINDYSDLELHDVVTYKGLEGSYKGKIITHQIIEIIEEEGHYSFITQGTKEGAPIDPKIDESQLISKMLFEIPLLGSIITFLSNRIVFFFVIIIPLAVMLVLEFKNFVKILKTEEEEDIYENDEN